MAYRTLAGSVSRIVAMLIGGLAALALGPDRPAVANSIYDSRVEQRLDLTSAQRPHVSRILAESKRQAMAVFKKYGIDPNGMPIFDQLFAASNELMAIERQERQAMKQILSPEQLAHYDAIINDTRIRVRKAAQ
jgi:hypothetical protein